MESIDIELRKHKFIVFCEDHFNPLGICRSLGEVGISPIVVAFGAKPHILKRCKYVKSLHWLPNIEEGLNFIIEKFGNEEFKPFIFTGADNTTQLLDEHYDDLINHFFFFNCGGKGLISKYMEKNTICDIAEKCGINKPKGEVLKRGELPRNLRYPVITKVTMSTKGGWKDDVYICDNKDELKEAYKHIKADELLVQEFIDKKNELCVDGISINEGKEIWFPYTSEYIRFLKKSYGEYMWIKPYEDKKVREKIHNIIKATKFSGIFSLECLIDKNDDLHFLEVNFRNSTWSYAYTYAGLNLPYQWAKGILTKSFDYESVTLKREPFKAMTEPSDFINSVVREKQVNLRQWIKDIRSCEVTYYFNKRDKKPLIGFFVARLVSAIKSKLHHS